MKIILLPCLDNFLYELREYYDSPFVPPSLHSALERNLSGLRNTKSSNSAENIYTDKTLKLIFKFRCIRTILQQCTPLTRMILNIYYSDIPINTIPALTLYTGDPGISRLILAKYGTDHLLSVFSKQNKQLMVEYKKEANNYLKKAIEDYETNRSHLKKENGWDI